METAKKIVWLASYPKSGNTWFRAFLTALLNDAEVDINDLKTDGIFSSRSSFDCFTDLDSTYLTDNEVKLLQPLVFNKFATFDNKEFLFIKVHDAYTLNRHKHPIIPTENSLCAIYIIRNPFDIVPSLAHHNLISLAESIELINEDNACFSEQNNNNNNLPQTKQLLLDWSSHVNSWINQNNIPVLVVRYEDMLTNSINTFSKCCQFIGIKKGIADIQKAIEASSFYKLKQQETVKGFREKTNGNFFRKGMQGEGKIVLTQNQLRNIEQKHYSLMRKFKYL